MKKIEKLLRMKLAQKAKDVKLEPDLDCLSDLELSHYACGILNKAQNKLIEEHLAECFLCLDKVVSVYEGEKLFGKRRLKSPPKRFSKNIRKNKWLIASIIAFILSFALPRFFLQFLLAAGILGGKWIFDSENARTLIMIYNAWKKGGNKEAGEMIEALKDRVSRKTS